MLKKFLLFVCLSFSFVTYSRAQFLMTADVGQMKTQFGDPSNRGTAVRISPYFGVGFGAVAFGHSQRTHGVNFYGGFDVKFPSQSDGANGGIMDFGGLAQVNWRRGPASVGVGIEGREFSMPSDTELPDELLFGMPISGKLSFGPGGHAYVQGGITPYFANYAQTYVNGGSTGLSGSLTSDSIKLDNTRTSYEAKVSGGYVFGHFGLRMNYTHRVALFNVTGPDYNGGALDYTQNLLSGGIILTSF